MKGLLVGVAGGIGGCPKPGRWFCKRAYARRAQTAGMLAGIRTRKYFASEGSDAVTTVTHDASLLRP